MEIVSIILSTRHCTGNNIVEVIGECEKEYNELTLYSFATEIIKKAARCGGTIIPWAGEPQYQKFYCAFEFTNENTKKKFLKSLYEEM